MFGVSGGELIILLLIGLVVLGPERLPRIANQIGGWLGQARRMTRVMKRQLEEELDLNQTLNIKPPPSSRTPSSKSDQTGDDDKDDKPESEESPPDDPDSDDTEDDELSDSYDSSKDHSEPRDDDDYSPEHGPDEKGTGVGDAIYDDVDDLAVTEADRKRPSDELDESAIDPVEDDAKKKAAS